MQAGTARARAQRSLSVRSDQPVEDHILKLTPFLDFLNLMSLVNHTDIPQDPAGGVVVDEMSRRDAVQIESLERKPNNLARCLSAVPDAPVGPADPIAEFR